MVDENLHNNPTGSYDLAFVFHQKNVSSVDFSDTLLPEAGFFKDMVQNPVWGIFKGAECNNRKRLGPSNCGAEFHISYAPVFIQDTEEDQMETIFDADGTAIRKNILRIHTGKEEEEREEELGKRLNTFGIQYHCKSGVYF
jgi:hypothetical protein